MCTTPASASVSVMQESSTRSTNQVDVLLPGDYDGPSRVMAIVAEDGGTSPSGGSVGRSGVVIVLTGGGDVSLPEDAVGPDGQPIQSPGADGTGGSTSADNASGNSTSASAASNLSLAIGVVVGVAILAILLLTCIYCRGCCIWRLRNVGKVCFALMAPNSVEGVHVRLLLFD